MEVKGIRVEESPRAPGWLRLRAEVVYETGPLRSEEYWFETSRCRGEELSRSGNPWLACLLPLAAVTGEAVRVPLPVDRPLLDNATRLMRIWRAWYPGLAVAKVEADARELADPETQERRRTAAFFSGGADSLFTALRERESAAPPERAPIEDLITIWGFDLPLDRPSAFARVMERHQRLSQQLGVELVDAATNIRSTRWHGAQWSYLAHGAGLAAVALSLERRFRRVYIAGGGGYRGLHPWGSHSVTDPLFSTLDTALVYDAVAWLRTEKLERLASSRLALESLRVCYETRTEDNCGVCNKCRRTMLTLEICGVLRDCPAFPRRSIDLEEVARMDCSHFADFREFQDIRGLAVERGRLDVVRALDRSVKRTEWRRRWQHGRAWVRRTLTGRPDWSPVRRITEP